MRASDPAGSYSEQTFTVTSQVNRVGELPTITSVPSGPVTLGDTFTDQVVAFDPNGAPLSYTLLQPASGASLSSRGKLTVTPTATGPLTFQIKVADGMYGYVTQTFTLDVQPKSNHASRIMTAPVGPAMAGRAWTYQAAATDPDGDHVTFSLSDSGSDTVMRPNRSDSFFGSAALLDLLQLAGRAFFVGRFPIFSGSMTFSPSVRARRPTRDQNARRCRGLRFLSRSWSLNFHWSTMSRPRDWPACCGPRRECKTGWLGNHQSQAVFTRSASPVVDSLVECNS